MHDLTSDFQSTTVQHWLSLRTRTSFSRAIAGARHAGSNAYKCIVAFQNQENALTSGMTRGSSKQPVVCFVLPGIARSLPPRAHHILHAPHPMHTTLRTALPICPPFRTPDAPSATALPPIDRPQEDSPSANGMCCVCSAALHPAHIMESAMSGVKMTHAIELAPSAARMFTCAPTPHCFACSQR